MVITFARARALEVLAAHAEFPDAVTAAVFARMLWPYAAGWSKASNAGTHGTRYGCGMWRAGGGFLGKLTKEGLAHCWLRPGGQPEWSITAAGLAALREYEEDPQ